MFPGIPILPHGFKIGGLGEIICDGSCAVLNVADIFLSPPRTEYQETISLATQAFRLPLPSPSLSTRRAAVGIVAPSVLP